MRAILFSVVSASTVMLSGCGFVRSIEQWKCDNWGMCHFGITPSVPHHQPWDPAAYPPISGYHPGQGLELQAPTHHDLGAPTPHCENCKN